MYIIAELPLLVENATSWVTAITAVLVLVGLLHQFFVKPIIKNLMENVTKAVEDSYRELERKVDKNAELVRTHLEAERWAEKVMNLHMREFIARLEIVEKSQGISYPFRMASTFTEHWPEEPHD